MSTKTIREVLTKVRDNRHALTLEDAMRASAALAEVEAIEKAAKLVVELEALEDWNTAQPVELADSIRLIQAIATESR